MRIFFLMAASFFLFFSCKKNQLGGDALIEGNMAHHGKGIGKGTIFIKYNAAEFPGKDTNLYDAKIKPDSEGNFSVKVYKGQYYLYGLGLDFGIPAPYIVDGGVPVKIRAKEVVKINLPVTEQH